MFHEAPSMTIGRLVAEASKDSKLGRRRKDFMHGEATAEAEASFSASISSSSERWTALTLLGGGSGGGGGRGSLAKSDKAGRKKKKKPSQSPKRRSTGTFLDFSISSLNQLREPSERTSLELPSEPMDKESLRSRLAASRKSKREGAQSGADAREKAWSGADEEADKPDNENGEVDMDSEDSDENHEEDDDETSTVVSEHDRGLENDDDDDNDDEYDHEDDNEDEQQQQQPRSRSQSLYDAEKTMEVMGGFGETAGGRQRRKSMPTVGEDKVAAAAAAATARGGKKRGMMTAEEILTAHFNRVGYMKSMGYGTKPERSKRDQLTNSERAALEQGLQCKRTRVAEPASEGELRLLLPSPARIPPFPQRFLSFFDCSVHLFSSSYRSLLLLLTAFSFLFNNA